MGADPPVRNSRYPRDAHRVGMDAGSGRAASMPTSGDALIESRCQLADSLIGGSDSSISNPCSETNAALDSTSDISSD